MGIFSAILGGVATTTTKNRLNPPTIIIRDLSYVCKGISPNGLYKCCRNLIRKNFNLPSYKIIYESLKRYAKNK